MCRIFFCGDYFIWRKPNTMLMLKIIYRFSAIIIAITLLLASVFLFSFAITGDVKAIEHFYKKSYVQKPLTTVEENAFLDLKLLAKNNPLQLLDIEQLQKINAPSIETVV